MKKLLTLAALVLCAVFVKAQDDNKNNPIVGIWQQCTLRIATDGSKVLISYPNFKIINEDNSYTVIAGSNRIVDSFIDMNAVISQEGRWYPQNDSIYNEQIDKHYINPGMNNSTSIIKYRLDGNNLIMLVEFDNGAMQIKGKEIWKKVLPLNR